MSLLALFRPAPPRQPGRHSVEWAAMQQGLTALTQRCRTFEAAATTLKADLDEQAGRHTLEIEGWKDALGHASTEYAALKRAYDQVDADCTRLQADNQRLQLVLDASDGQPTLAVAALADEPDSFTAVPDPAPRPAFRIGEDIPPGPVGSEAADVCARTQQTDVRGLRASTEETQAVDVRDLRKAAGLGETAVLPVVALPPDLEPALVLPPSPWPAVRLRSDLRTTWTGGATVRPLADALGATADLKASASATATLPISRTFAVLAKTGGPS